MPQHSSNEGSTEKIEYIESKKDDIGTAIRQVDTGLTSDQESETIYTRPAETAKDLVTEVILVEDDPSLSPWTFRTWFLGCGLAVFGSATTAINTFKPQPVHIHLVFLVVLSYVLGMGCEKLLPKRGRIGRFLNPFPVCYCLYNARICLSNNDQVQFERAGCHCDHGWLRSSNSGSDDYACSPKALV